MSAIEGIRVEDDSVDIQLLRARYRKARENINIAMQRGKMGPTAHRKAMNTLEKIGAQIAIAEIKTVFS